MKRVRLYSCMVVAGAVLSFPSVFAAEQAKPAEAKAEKPAAPMASGKDAVPGADAKKQNAGDKKQTYSDREMSEATLNALITLAGQITKALTEVKDKQSAEDCIAKLEIISKVKDKIQAHTANLAPPDMETSKDIMNKLGPRLQSAFNELNKEVMRIQKARYYESVKFRTALENLLKAPASGMPVV